MNTEKIITVVYFEIRIKIAREGFIKDVVNV